VAYQNFEYSVQPFLLQHYPNVDAVANTAGNVAHENQRVVYASACCARAYSYFKSKYNNYLTPYLSVFKSTHFLTNEGKLT
jgi:hypothetical protein